MAHGVASQGKKIAYFVAWAVKFGFKGVLQMPFNLFINLLNEAFKIEDERGKRGASLMRFARFADDKEFKKFTKIKEDISEEEPIERLNRW